MDMRRDGESRGCREAGERDLVIKSSLHQRVYLGLLGHDRLKKRGGMGCGVPTTLASRKGHDGARPSAGGVQMGGASVRGTRYNMARTVQQVRGDLAAGTYQACVCPFTPAGARRRRQEKQQARVGTKGGYLGLLA